LTLGYVYARIEKRNAWTITIFQLSYRTKRFLKVTGRLKSGISRNFKTETLLIQITNRKWHGIIE